jgi:hypothetical protein
MNQSQCVAQYISDNENEDDMELGSFNNSGIVKQNPHTPSSNYICKHVIGMSIRLKYCKPPPEAKNVEVGTKRKRGRTSKARKALLLQ